MKDGFIQQVDSPQNLYDHPVNLFVGGFIGSPQMNFINVKLEKEGDDVFAVFGDNKIKVPEGKIKKFKDLSCIGQEVIMGIRPEDIHDEEVFLQNSEESTVKAYVEVVELMGSETYLYLNIAGNNVTARVDPRSTARTGDTIRVALDQNRLHFFNKETEESLLNR
jgi:multiple sugar transport system ATP-binding protein